MAAPNKMTCGSIGFPRTGPRREMKLALERHWAGELPEAALLDAAARADEAAWRAQAAAGLDRVALDGTLYDHVLDVTHALGLAPPRLRHLSGLALYFACARGAPGGAEAMDMSKLLDTNYHFIVPELDADFAVRAPNFAPLLDRLQRGQAALGGGDDAAAKARAVPMLVGPVSYVLLARRDAALSLDDAVDRLLPAYSELLRALQTLGAAEVQLHEPALATDAGAAARAAYERAYAALSAVGLPIDLVAVYDDLSPETYPWAVRLPVAAVTLDFCGVPGAAAGNATLALVRAHGFPAGKRLGAGVVDARSVWADDLPAAAAVLAELRALLGAGSDLAVTPSTSLMHLPWDTAPERGHLPDALLSRLAFAVQKLGALRALADGAVAAAPRAAAEAWGLPPDGGSGTKRKSTKDDGDDDDDDSGKAGGGAALPGVDAALLTRAEPYEARRAKQVQTGAFPTTAIGSYPQTAEVRRLRTLLKKGALSRADYERLIDQQIALAVGVQEAVGLDVLVHGEPERTDMVEYFGMQLQGMAFTTQGWVQSYGSRYVRPPIIAGDVAFVRPMTAREYAVAQQLTAKPVKGMLTGPVTVLNWSFPRKDISRAAQAAQLALALRREVDTLQACGCRIVQVDEPALREGLPLKRERWDAYLAWAVDAFRLCTAVAEPKTQVVTHLCYSDFQDIMAAVDRMDADVLTIENSRSGDAMVSALAAAGYGRDLGPGVYDVHSPVVPSVEFLVDKLQGFVDSGVLAGRPEHIWVNPDCGLKTRRWAEVIPSLRNMVEAAAVMRARAAAAAATDNKGGSATAGAKAAAAAATTATGGGGGCRAAGCCLP